MIRTDAIVKPTVIVIDDDAAVREAIEGLLETVALDCRCFSSVEHYLADPFKPVIGCIILDVRLPGRSGLEFNDQMCRDSGAKPVIFISGHADVQMSVRGMKAGAIDFLTKPVRHQELLDAIQAGIRIDRERHVQELALAQVRQRLATLTAREVSVAQYVITGQLNKQIAGHLGLSEATVKLHRGRVMQKMGAHSLVDLLRMFDALGLCRGDAGRPG